MNFTLGCEHHTIRDSECVANQRVADIRRHRSSEICDFEANFIFAAHM